MNSRMTPMICTLIAVVAVFSALRAAGEGAADFKLMSEDIGTDKPLAQDFLYNARGCMGGNQSPALSWIGAPSGTKSFAIVLFDPDAMQGRGLLHWLMINIPTQTVSLDRDAGKGDGSKLPTGAAQLRNGFRENGYSGLCPPTADAPHTYLMTLYALNTAKIELPPDVSSITMLNTIEGSAIAKSSITYLFGRQPTVQ